jgi:hypothetical protein
MTMAAAWPPGIKVAHEVSPIKGAILACSIVTATSFLGLLTLKVFSFSLNVPFSPVIDSIFAVSRAFSAAKSVDPEVQRLVQITAIRGKD